jgi:outer membrane protein OmpA-like peptidoglycan-associated protein/tetratricopeptide (TPR) repeat protein
MKHVYFLFLLTIPLISHSQNEDESCLPPNKKVLKLLETASKAQDVKTASESYMAAVEAAPDNAMVYYEYAMFAYETGLNYYDKQPNPALGDKSFQKAEELFQKAIENCSDYHSNCYYFLGVINYTQKDMKEAIRWFNAFKSFKHSDNNKYANDHDKRIKDVTEVLADLEAQEDILSKQVPFSPSIVKNVSTKNDEYFPMISPDNELIFYTRKKSKAGMGDELYKDALVVEEFTFSQRPDVNSLFNSGEGLKPPFNTGEFSNYGSATLSVDNKEMIICACKKETVYGREYLNCDLYSTKYERSGAGGNDFSWTPLKNLGPNINTKDGWEAQPSLSADGNTLFYTAARPTTRDNDIFIAQRNSDGSWGQARPFDEINTDGKDKSPFLHQDSETLYFVSTTTDKRRGVGGLDIFYIREENGVWGKPKNIGYPINSKEDELGLFVSTDGKIAYFSSRVGGVWNIYSFELYEEARPKPVAILKGELKDESGEPVKDATIEVTYSNSDKVSQVKVNGDDGKYATVVKLDKAQDVMVTVKKEGHAFDSKVITKEDIKPEKVSIKGNDLTVREIKVGEAYTINDILYATNSSVLTERSKFILKGFARFLKENPTIQVSIQGHTDDVGDDTKNLELSEQRAVGVKEYLISQGVKADRLKAEGFGETQPKVPNTSEANRAKNRRTDFVIDKM